MHIVPFDLRNSISTELDTAQRRDEHRHGGDSSGGRGRASGQSARGHLVTAR